ncbi:LysR family transcriptional regulator [Mesorhizobium sp. L-8-3]|uniref:LysR family transcriptional regulator n=1 Tax=Mesorhizobium sp. L-8-3 TaxID=2744522 RepID=UPI001926780C|nr:LysR family transcriptional regulator [Mesorhizobium sp. L-8-3]BCH22281.1 LysR family transcriptional regulator [Mesorhizobium sp. L-8-3]
MDRLVALGAFVQAAEAGSFVAAGRQLGMSASAVGKAVARLEGQLGVRLFHRSTRTMMLTADGGIFLERCRRILREIEAAEQELSEAASAPRGTLRVSLPIAEGLLLPTIAAFMRAYPDIRMEIDFSDRLVDIIEEGFDAVVRTGDVADSRLMSRKLGSFPHRLVAAPAYLARRGVPAVPEDLTKHACLHHRHPTSGKLEPWPLVRDGADLDIEFPVAATVSTIEARAYLAEEGFGIACLPAYAVTRQIAAGRLVSLLEGSVRDCGALRVLWPASRSPRIRAFVDFLAERLVVS